MEEISFGQYALPVILMVGLAFFYKIFDKADGTSYIPNRLKPLIAISLGIILGIVAMFYNGIQPVFKNIVDYVLYGFMAGAGAVGLWEGFSAVKSGSNGAAKGAKMILIIFLLPAMLMGPLTSCSTLQGKWKTATEDEKARLILADMQTSVDSMLDFGSIYIASHPDKKTDWQTRVLPLFKAVNDMIGENIQLAKANEGKVTVAGVLSTIQPKIAEIEAIVISWGFSKK
jgi:hypothetical protein